MRAGLGSRLVGGALFGAALLCAGATGAQPAAAIPPAAQALYDAATAAIDHKDFDAACPKLEQVVKLVPDGIGARVTLGACYEGAGKLASAWTAYSGAAATADRIGQSPRADKARHNAEALKPKLAVLRIVLAPDVAAPPGLTVQRDGLAFDATSLGVALPVDRGPHPIVVSAPGKRPWTKTVDVDHDGANVVVTVDALVDAPAEAAPVSAPRAASPPPRGVPSLAIAGFVVGGVGVVAGAVSGAVTLTKASSCKQVVGGCAGPAGGSARATAWISDVAFGVGAAGLAVGLVAIIARPAQQSVALRVGPTSVAVEGTF